MKLKGREGYKMNWDYALVIEEPDCDWWYVVFSQGRIPTPTSYDHKEIMNKGEPSIKFAKQQAKRVFMLKSKGKWIRTSTKGERITIEVNPKSVEHETADWSRDNQERLQKEIKRAVEKVGYKGIVNVKVSY